MKWLFALVVLTAVGAAAVATKVVLDNRDPVPADTLRCVRKAGLELARGRDAVGVMRQDALAGTLKITQRWDWGRSSGALIRGAQNDYVALALWNKDTPSLAGARSPVRVYERPSDFPVVVVETPDQGALERCARRN